MTLKNVAVANQVCSQMPRGSVPKVHYGTKSNNSFEKFELNMTKNNPEQVTACGTKLSKLLVYVIISTFSSRPSHTGEALDQPKRITSMCKTLDFFRVITIKSFDYVFDDILSCRHRTVVGEHQQRGFTSSGRQQSLSCWYKYLL